MSRLATWVQDPLQSWETEIPLVLVCKGGWFLLCGWNSSVLQASDLLCMKTEVPVHPVASKGPLQRQRGLELPWQPPKELIFGLDSAWPPAHRQAHS